MSLLHSEILRALALGPVQHCAPCTFPGPSALLLRASLVVMRVRRDASCPVHADMNRNERLGHEPRSQSEA